MNNLTDNLELHNTTIRPISGLVCVLVFRLLGMFMIAPVLSIYATELIGSTPLLIGLASGAYGLTQAGFQIPFGIMSDYIGRRKVIYLGLALFGLGSILAGYTESIWGLIVARALQGSGAISAVIFAYVSDLTNDRNRTKAMGIIGLIIGLSFAISTVLGPLLARSIGLSGLFLITTLMALLGILIIKFTVPSNTEDVSYISRKILYLTLSNPDLIKLNISIGVLHSILMSFFIALPIYLKEKANLQTGDQWIVYLVSVTTSLIIVVPLIIYAEKRKKTRVILIGAILTLALDEIFLWNCGNGLPALIASAIIFFTGFNLLEALLPSLVSKISIKSARGTAMSLYSTSQFLGNGLGAIFSGILYQYYGVSFVFLGAGTLAVFWAIIAYSIRIERI